MKNILKSMLAIAFMATLSGYANAKSLSRLCFQTGTSTQSCEPVTVANPLPTTASLAVSSLNVTGPFNVTVTNTAALPVIVSNPNGLGGSGSVTITNTAAVPVIVSTANGFGGGSGTGPYNVTLTNTVAIPAVVTCTNCGAASVTGPFNVTITNTPAVTLAATNVTLTNTVATPAIVTCTNCGSSSISSITVLNQTMASAI